MHNLSVSRNQNSKLTNFSNWKVTLAQRGNQGYPITFPSAI